VVHDGFGHDGTCRVSPAEEKNVIASLHGYRRAAEIKPCGI
jgi:hypothetical protein